MLGPAVWLFAFVRSRRASVRHYRIGCSSHDLDAATRNVHEKSTATRHNGIMSFSPAFHDHVAEHGAPREHVLREAPPQPRGDSPHDLAIAAHQFAEPNVVPVTPQVTVDSPDW
jgi:hypothetical protein